MNKWIWANGRLEASLVEVIRVNVVQLNTTAQRCRLEWDLNSWHLGWRLLDVTKWFPRYISEVFTLLGVVLDQQLSSSNHIGKAVLEPANPYTPSKLYYDLPITFLLFKSLIRLKNLIVMWQFYGRILFCSGTKFVAFYQRNDTLGRICMYIYTDSLAIVHIYKQLYTLIKDIFKYSHWVSSRARS